MSGYNEWSDENEFENERGSQGGGGLRKMLEETLAENKRLIQKLEERDRGKSTAALLKDKGLDPAIAEIIPEGEDAAAWVNKYAHLLGVPANSEDETPAADPELQLSDDDDPAVQLRRAELAAEQKALADMQDAQEQGLPASVHNDLIDRMEKVQTEEELLKFFRENGAPQD